MGAVTIVNILPGPWQNKNMFEFKMHPHSLVYNIAAIK